MSNSGGSALTRMRWPDRFYTTPAARKYHQLIPQQQLQQRELQNQKTVKKSERRVDSSKAETRADSDESTLSRPNSVCSSSPPRNNVDFTNLDRLIESVTPLVPAQLFSEARTKGRRTREDDIHPFFSLGDLWESFREWSVYGVGVPLVLNGSDSVKQYYVPFLSGIQLYVDPNRLR